MKQSNIVQFQIATISLLYLTDQNRLKVSQGIPQSTSI